MTWVFWFVPWVSSTWWNFTNDEFEDLKANSIKMPIFVVCYSQWCPHCSGLPEGTVQYSESDGNRSDVYITMLDCSVREECGHFHVTGTPHMVLVMGQKRRYWPRIGYRDGKEWNIFIDKFVKPSLREVTSDEELLAAKREPYDGGSTFHLETPTTDSALMQELAELSKEFRIYNDTFTYRLNPNLNAPVLTAHTSPYCSVTWKSGSVRDFLEKYKFGSRHRYDMDEFRAVRGEKQTAMVLVDEEITNGQRYALEKIPRNFCDDIVFGWVSIKETKRFLHQLKKESIALPMMVYISPQKCHAYHLGRARDADASGFLARASRGELCGKIFINGTFWDDEVLEEEEETETPKPDAQRGQGAIGGTGMTCAFMAVGLLFIGIIRVRTPVEGKQE